jgi:hypothetical protein
MTGWTGYLAGSMTKQREQGWNYTQFNHWAAVLRCSGHTIHNPAEHFDGDTTLPRSMYIRAAVESVLKSDYVILLPGWEISNGANLEVDLAIELGLPIFELHPYSSFEYRLRPLSLKPRRPRRIT